MRVTVGLAVASVGQLILSFAWQWLTVTVIGASIETDALFAAATVPQIVVSVLVVSISQVVLAQLARKNDEDSATAALGTAIILSTGLLVIGVILAAGSALWLPGLFPSLYAARPELLSTLLWISVAGMVAQSAETILWAHHHARREHLFADGTALVSTTLGILVLAVVLPRFGVLGAAWVTALRPMLHLAMLLHGVRPVWNRLFERRALRSIVREAWAPMTGAMYYKFDILIDRVLSGLAGPGALSVYYLGHQMSSACGQVLSNSLANPAVPVISKAVITQDAVTVRRELLRRSAAILVLALAGLGLFYVIGRPLLTLVFGRGALTPEQTELLFLVFLLLGGVVIGGAIGQMTASTFYAMKQSRTPPLIGIVTYTLYVPLKVLAFKFGGLTAMALSVSVFYGVNLLLQSGILAYRLGSPDGKHEPDQ